MRILLVEDDAMLGDAIKTALENERNVVDLVCDASGCESACSTVEFDIILLDINLPDKSGLEILRNLRRQKKQTPVLIMSARSALSQKVEGLDLGADDYLAKPFALEELLARIRSLGRRSKGISDPILSFESIKLNPVTHDIFNGKTKLDLSPSEFMILKTLLENAKKTVSRSKLENSLYSWDDSVASNAIEVHIHNLRKKLGGNFIKTVRGVGYSLS